MRINLAKKIQKGLPDRFCKELIREFADEYDFQQLGTALTYATMGKQGLTAFVNFLNSRGYRATSYHLDPNKDLFVDVGEDWTRISRNSPSFGFVIPDDDPKLVEFKLKHL